MTELSNPNRVDYGIHALNLHSALTHKDIKPLVEVCIHRHRYLLEALLKRTDTNAYDID